MSFSGQILWLGNNPNSTGTLWTADGRPQIEALPEEFQRRIQGAGEVANLDLFHETAVAYIVEHPAQFVRRCLMKFVYFWWFAPSYAKGPQYVWAPAALAAGYKLVYFVTLLLALAGTVAAVGDRVAEAALLWAPAIALDLLHCVHYVEGRHRLLVLPLLLILAGRGIMSLRVKWCAAP